MSTFLSSRVKDLKIGIEGYTNSVDVVKVIGNVNIEGVLKVSAFNDGISTGLNNYVITSDGQGGWSWASASEIGAVTGAAGLNGQFQFNSDGLLGGASQIYYDALTGRMGVGTDSPGYLFEVDGAASFKGEVRDKDGDVGVDGQILMSTGSGVNWVDAAPANAITGLNIREEGVLQGDPNAVATLNFVGSYITATVDGSSATITLSSDPNFTSLTVNSNIVWHAGNDGTGSGLDADLLDGQDGLYYLDYNNFSNRPTIGNGILTVNGGSGLSGSGTFTANQSGNTTITVSHANTSSQVSVDNSNGFVIQDLGVDSFGHVTSVGSTDLDSRYYTETESDERFLGTNTNLGDLNDVNTNDKVEKSVLTYDQTSGKFVANDVNTILTITDGGNF
jgi:hypothetical protein